MSIRKETCVDCNVEYPSGYLRMTLIGLVCCDCLVLFYNKHHPKPEKTVERRVIGRSSSGTIVFEDEIYPQPKMCKCHNWLQSMCDARFGPPR